MRSRGSRVGRLSMGFLAAAASVVLMAGCGGNGSLIPAPNHAGDGIDHLSQGASVTTRRWGAWQVSMRPGPSHTLVNRKSI